MITEQTNDFVKPLSFFRPKKRLGQNFLVAKKAISRIISVADLKKTDVVMEIGPGLGAITKELAGYVKKVIAVEKDKELAKTLQGLLECWNVRNVEVIPQDILELQVSSYKLQEYKVIGNLPFYITYHVIRKFAESRTPPKLMVFVAQKEVGERICAKPPNMSKPAVFTQFYAKPEIKGKIKRTCFYPQPKVDSAILKITPVDKFQRFNLWNFPKGDLTTKMEKVVSAGFSHPRKQLANNLSKELKIPKPIVENWLRKNNISPSQRAETLRVEDWINLTKSLKF